MLTHLWYAGGFAAKIRLFMDRRGIDGSIYTGFMGDIR